MNVTFPSIPEVKIFCPDIVPKFKVNTKPS